MLTYAELVAAPQRIRELEGQDALVSASSAREVVIQQKVAFQPEATMVFMHETIQMMMADRADRLEKLRSVLAPGSTVIPLRKKPESFWDQITVGRASTADIVLEDPAVSNVHAHFLVDVEGQSVSVQDVGSSNGTFVNREPLQPHAPTTLTSGDCLRFGQSVVYFVTNVALAELLKPRV